MVDPKNLGVMRPIGGGDPIPLKKTELIIGRRPSADIRLDFENVSGKHCVLKHIHGTWHVRDLGSTNGTSVNGQKISSEHGVMPDDELGIASHLFRIDYEPAAPVLESQIYLEEQMQKHRQTSLMELAGLEREDRNRGTTRRPAASAPRRPVPETQVGDEIDFDAPPTPRRNEPEANDDDFFKFVEDDLKK
jgi:hypothetical protein